MSPSQPGVEPIASAVPADEVVDYAEPIEDSTDGENVDYAESADEMPAVAKAEIVYEVIPEPPRPFVPPPPGWRDRPVEYGLSTTEPVAYVPPKEYSPPPGEPYDVSFADHKPAAEGEAPSASQASRPQAEAYCVRDSEPAGAGGPAAGDPDRSAAPAPVLTGTSEGAFARRMETDARSPRKTVTWDLDCIRCGYNLKTMSETARCPECGTPVRWSMADLLDPVSAAQGVRFTAIARLAALLVAPLDATGPGVWLSSVYAERLGITPGVSATAGIIAGLAVVAFTMYAVRRVRNAVGGRCIVDYGDEGSKLKWTLVGEMTAGSVSALMAALMFFGPRSGSLVDVLGFWTSWFLLVMLPWPILSLLRNRWMCALWSELSAGAARTDLSRVFEILGTVHAWGVFAGVMTVISLIANSNLPGLTAVLATVAGSLLISGQAGMVISAFVLAGALRQVGDDDAREAAAIPQ